MKIVIFHSYVNVHRRVSGKLLYTLNLFVPGLGALAVSSVDTDDFRFRKMSVPVSGSDEMMDFDKYAREFSSNPLLDPFGS